MNVFACGERSGGWGFIFLLVNLLVWRFARLGWVGAHAISLELCFCFSPRATKCRDGRTGGGSGGIRSKKNIRT